MRPPPPHMYTMQTDDPKIFFPSKSVDMALLKKQLAKHLVTPYQLFSTTPVNRRLVSPLVEGEVEFCSTLQAQIILAEGSVLKLETPPQPDRLRRAPDGADHSGLLGGNVSRDIVAAPAFVSGSAARIESGRGRRGAIMAIRVPACVRVECVLGQGRKLLSLGGAMAMSWILERAISPLPCGNIGASEYQSGCLLLPRDVAEDNNTPAEAVSRNVIEAGVPLVGAVPDGSAPVQTSNISNAVLPAWRGALVYRYLKIGWNSSATVRGQMEKDQDSLAHDKVPQLEVVTFESGAHLNEAHYRRLDFRDIFFGELQAKRLALRIKSLLTQQQVLVLILFNLPMTTGSQHEQAWEKAQAELAREAETASIPEVEIKSESTDSPENFKFKQRPSAAAPDETCTATKKHRISAGGCGKTATVRGIMARFDEQGLRHEALALTGIAALPSGRETAHSFMGWDHDSMPAPQLSWASRKAMRLWTAEIPYKLAYPLWPSTVHSVTNQLTVTICSRIGELRTLQGLRRGKT
ncbi:unnamed protein product [Diplocarpon coronariae]